MAFSVTFPSARGAFLSLWAGRRPA